MYDRVQPETNDRGAEFDDEFRSYLVCPIYYTPKDEWCESRGRGNGVTSYLLYVTVTVNSYDGCATGDMAVNQGAERLYLRPINFKFNRVCLLTWWLREHVSNTYIDIATSRP